MNSWYMVTDRGSGVEEAFRQIWLADGCPKDAALFAVQNTQARVTELYLNPSAAWLASGLLGQWQAVECAPLDLTNPHPFRGPVLVVGIQSIAEESS